MIRERDVELTTLRRRLAAYDHIVAKETRMQRPQFGSPVGVALAATSLMDDPHAASTQVASIESATTTLVDNTLHR